jgi:hypothetical protein
MDFDHSVHTRIFNVLIMVLLLAAGAVPLQVKAQGSAGTVYLPAIFNNHNPLAGLQIVNVPYLPSSDVTGSAFGSMAIFWFGKVHLDTNYTDVRIAYNEEALWIHLATFDRRLWFDSAPGSTAENWDAATLLLQLDGDTSPAHPQVDSYRFVAQMNWSLKEENAYQAYCGNGNRWVACSTSISNYSGWEGDSPNNDGDDRGWKMVFRIPFSSLGLSNPADGTTWRFGLLIHDRDAASGSPLPGEAFPDQLDPDIPSTWGRIRFGMPEYSAPEVANLTTTVIRNGLKGALVPDVDAGGWATCGEGLNMWTQWGEKNYAGQREINIQNQQNLGDWPCFSKYYVTFPLNSIPSGKVIRSAKLRMYQFGGSDPSQATGSLIEALRVSGSWDENTLNWNNAPQIFENISQKRVGVFAANRTDYCPGDVYEWDVSRAMLQAYEEGQPLRLALYSADFDMHSGKYFYSSDNQDCGGTSRPTLVVEWGDSY